MCAHSFADAKSFQGVALTMQATEAADLDANVLASTLLKCGGAHKPSSYDFGGGQHVDVASL